MLQISEEAAEVIERAYDAAVRFDPTARIRISRRGNDIDTGFVDSPAPGDEVVQLGEMTVFVERGIEGVLGVSEQHERLLLHPA